MSNERWEQRPAADAAGVLDDFDKQVELLFDLIALAYRSDLTRVVTFMMVKRAYKSDVQPHRCSRLVPSFVAPRE
jgi:hypothetical protein